MHSDDIARIIQSCKDAGVRELSYRGLQLRFDAPESLASQIVGKQDESLLKKRQLQSAAARRALREDEASFRQDQIDLMKIEDPVQYEELVLTGELKAELDEDDET